MDAGVPLLIDLNLAPEVVDALRRKNPNGPPVERLSVDAQRLLTKLDEFHKTVGQNLTHQFGPRVREMREMGRR